jgi:hypothetical protein
LLGACASARVAAEERRCSAPTEVEVPFETRDQTVRQLRGGPNFILVSNVGALAESACVLQKLAKSRLLEIAEQARTVAGVDPQIAIVLTTAALACGDLFYLAIANDVRGIGYQHQDPREVFDDSPQSRLEGIAFLNDWPYWHRHADEFSKAFNHEVGHRWGARVHMMQFGGASQGLLGRQALHWSYFLDTGGSPLEGNAWTSVGGQSYRANTPFELRAFSDFDLYLMGVLPAAEVAREQLLSSTARRTDCLDARLTAASPPQSCGSLDLPAHAESIELGAVIEEEGPRIPPPDPTPRHVDVAVIVLDSGQDTFDAARCESLAAALDARFADFGRASRGRVLLDNLTLSDVTCSEAFAASIPTTPVVGPSGCQLLPQRRGERALLLLGLLLLGLRAATLRGKGWTRPA